MLRKILVINDTLFMSGRVYAHLYKQIIIFIARQNIEKHGRFTTSSVGKILEAYSFLLFEKLSVKVFFSLKIV